MQAISHTKSGVYLLRVSRISLSSEGVSTASASAPALAPAPAAAPAEIPEYCTCVRKKMEVVQQMRVTGSIKHRRSGVDPGGYALLLERKEPLWAADEVKA